METISREQIEIAVEALKGLMQSRGLNQVELGQLSDVNQSTISKIQSGQQQPTLETLNKLFEALGVKLEYVLKEYAPATDVMVGYLASPLTAVTTDVKADKELRHAVETIKRVAGQQEFPAAPTSFQLYWPGDYTHPLNNPQFTPAQVYVIDRSRASTFDFIILLCASPSYGVGQENEIATQAGLPAIRIAPTNTSRMIKGSFLLAHEVPLEGSLQTGLRMDEIALGEAFRQIRRIYLRHRVVHGPRNTHSFGDRLRSLLNDRLGDYTNFAEELGVSSSYLQALLNEPLVVTNPSAWLLLRMAKLLHVSVGYLFRETIMTDPIYTESMANWRQWTSDNLGEETELALAIRDQWCEKYYQDPQTSLTASYRNSKLRAMSVDDWDKLYTSRARELRRPQQRNRGQDNGRLF